MPAGKYGPAGKWIHDRAHRIMESTADEYGKKRGKSIAYAIATQQAHKVKKTPKRGAGPRGMYGTLEGKAMAKAKHDKPMKTYKKTAAKRELDLEEVKRRLRAGGRAVTKPIRDPKGYWKDVERVNRQAFGKKKEGHLPAGKSIRETLEKAAFTMGGQGSDLRQKPPMGMTTNFPTEYSKSFANKQLNQSQQAAEAGPMPNPAKLMPGGPNMKDLAPPSPTTKGSLPMAKTSQQDPLVAHLKQAMAVEDNKDSKVQGPKPEPELQSDEPGFSPQGVVAARKQREQTISQLFNAASSCRAHGLDRERQAKKA
jgi:hypothetical protein